MNKFSIVCIIVILLGVLFFQLYKYHINNDIEYNDYTIDDEWFTEKEVNDLTLDTLQIINSFNDSISTLNDILPRTKLLVRFSANGCSACIKRLISELYALKTNNPHCNITILVSDISIRDLYVNHVQSERKFEFYKVENFAIDSLIDPSSPYILEIERNGKIKSNFICQYGDTIQIRKYLNNINQ